jgi:hypothetical protein
VGSASRSAEHRDLQPRRDLQQPFEVKARGGGEGDGEVAAVQPLQPVGIAHGAAEALQDGIRDPFRGARPELFGEPHHVVHMDHEAGRGLSWPGQCMVQCQFDARAGMVGNGRRRGLGP